MDFKCHHKIFTRVGKNGIQLQRVSPILKSTSVHRPCSKRTELYTRNIDADEFVKKSSANSVDFFFIRTERSVLTFWRGNQCRRACVRVCAFACIWMDAVTAFARASCINVYATMCHTVLRKEIRRYECVFVCYLAIGFFQR